MPPSSPWPVARPSLAPHLELWLRLCQREAAVVRAAPLALASRRAGSPPTAQILYGVNQRLRVEDVDSPLCDIRPVKNVLMVVITGDRGLCGGYNNFIIKKVRRPAMAAMAAMAAAGGQRSGAALPVQAGKESAQGRRAAASSRAGWVPSTPLTRERPETGAAGAARGFPGRLRQPSRARG
jgi:hypothetical protein